jgi:hypothetical protein
VKENNTFAFKSAAEVKELCQLERRSYRNTHNIHSPACVELFRRAFNRDQQAWTAVVDTFQPEVQTQIKRVCDESNLPENLLDLESVVQEVFANFAKSAPKRAGDLVATDELGRIIQYLKRCSKTQLLQAWRKQRKEGKLSPVDPNTLEDSADLRLALEQRLEELLKDEKEKVIFTDRFVLRMKPGEIAENNRELFADIGEVYTIVQRLTRRLREDKELLALAAIRPSQLEKPTQRRKSDSDAFLMIRMLNSDEGFENREDSDVAGLCNLSEALLLDYIMGDAPPELIAAVERSPACRQAARQLADEIDPLLSILYRISCPDEDTLVDFQEGLLDGTSRLVIHKHIADCPLCKKELSMLRAFDQVFVQPERSLVRRLVEAIFQSPALLPAPVRGTILRYETPLLTIDLSERRVTGKPRSWTLTAQLRTHDGQPFTDVERILLQQIDRAEAQPFQEKISAHGSFRFRELPPGAYRLTILTPEEEITVREFAVGFD